VSIQPKAGVCSLITLSCPSCGVCLTSIWLGWSVLAVAAV
jgi:hypothetical protein